MKNGPAFSGLWLQAYFVEGKRSDKVHQQMAATLDTVISEIKDIQTRARSKGFKKRPQWPMIILRTLKGWTCPKVVDGLPIEGTFRAPPDTGNGHLTNPPTFENIGTVDEKL